MIVHRLILASVLPATTKDDTRYALDSIQVQNGGPNVRATATDGHILITATAPISAMPDADYPNKGPELEPTHTAMIPATVAAEIIKATKQTGRKRGVTTFPILAGTKIGTAGDRTIAVTTDLQDTRTYDLTPDADGGSFPDYDRIIKNTGTDPAVTVTLGVPVLRALIAAAMAGDANGITFKIPANNPTHSVVMDALAVTWSVKSDPQIEVMAVAMPMRA